MSELIFSTLLLAKRLDGATVEERLILTKILLPDASKPLDATRLSKEILRAGGNSVVNFLRSTGISYAEFLDDVAKQLKLKTTAYRQLTTNGLEIVEMDKRHGKTVVEETVRKNWEERLNAFIAEKERSILGTVMQQAYETMSSQQRSEVDQQIKRLAATMPGKDWKSLSASATIYAMANAGGFATYTLMSTIISTLTLGSVGFGVYTAASSLLSVFLGPVGWAALGLAAVHKFASPNQQKLVQLAVGIAMINARQSASETSSHLPLYT